MLNIISGLNINTKIESLILDYLHRRREEMTNLLKDLVTAESPSNVPESQAKVFAILADAYKHRDYRIQQIRGKKTGGHFLAIPNRRLKNQPIQLLLGHSDTVWQLGTIDKMPAKIKKGKLYGPGAYDMKAGLVFMLYAIEALKAHELEPEVAPIVFINSDEEIGSYESRNQIQRLAKAANRAFVMEPSLGREGKLKTRRKGVGEFTIRVIGKASHAGLAPEKGVSAILELSFLVQKLFALNNPEKGITVNVGVIGGGTRPNVVAPKSEAVVDVRILELEDAKQVEQAIYDIKPTLEGIKLEIEGGLERPPLEKTPGNEKLWQLAQQIAKELDIPLEEGTAGGGSDGNLTSMYTPTLDGMGAVGDGAHAPGEFVMLDSMVERVALLSRMLLEPKL